MSAAISNVRPKADKVLVDIVDYVMKYKISSREAYDTARLCLIDTLGCAIGAFDAEPARIARAVAGHYSSDTPARIFGTLK